MRRVMVRRRRRRKRRSSSSVVVVVLIYRASSISGSFFNRSSIVSVRCTMTSDLTSHKLSSM